MSSTGDAWARAVGEALQAALADSGLSEIALAVRGDPQDV